MNRRSARSKPRIHVEAYPRLDVREARAQVLAGRPTVLWRDLDHEVWGKAVVSIEPGRMSVDAAFRAIHGQRRSEQVSLLVLETVKRPEGATHSFTYCPVCNKRVRTLVWMKDRWSCRDCQQLANRSMFIGEYGRKTEKMAKIDAKIGGGRPIGMHESTYRALRVSRAILKEELQDEPSTPSSFYADVVSARWYGEAPELVDDDGPETGG